MSSAKKRILISFLFSIAGIFATWYFFKHFYPNQKYHIDEKPIAQVEEIENISRKKLSQHRTWQVIEFGEPLFSGETIKTSSDSELQIRFLETNAILNLEADSLITIRKSNGGISLNLLEGNLFVDSSQNTSQSALKLETKDGAIDLTKASASLSKSKDSAVDVNVISGKASLEGKDGQSKELEKKLQFAIAEPKQLAVIESKLPQVSIKWLGDPSIVSTQLIFKVGSKRSDLAVVTATVKNGTEAMIPVKFGKNLVQIEYPLTKQVTSVRFELKPLIDPVVEAAPPVVEPQAEILWSSDNEEVQTYVTTPEIDLRWSLKNPKQVKSLVVKIYEGEQLVHTDFVKVTDSVYKTKLQKPGRYLASIEAVDPENKNLAQTKLKAIITQELAYLPAVEWDSANPNHQAQLNGTYETRWATLPGAQQYKLVLKSKGKIIKEWTQKNSFTKLNGMLPGEYTLSLSTIDQYQRVSPNAVLKTLTVSEISEITAPKIKKLRFK